MRCAETGALHFLKPLWHFHPKIFPKSRTPRTYVGYTYRGLGSDRDDDDDDDDAAAVLRGQHPGYAGVRVRTRQRRSLAEAAGEH